MTKLKLQAFRKWNDISFDLGNGVTKITGESGMGKSTIFEAIYWCLYGKIRAVSPKTSGSTSSRLKTEVILEIPYNDGSVETVMQVHRSGMKSVSVIIGDEQYTGDIAQARIDDYFGQHDMFLMASYLRAEAAHPLISASPAEKRELTALVFPDASKYDQYKSKLIEIRRTDEYTLLQTRNKVLSAQSSLQALEESNGWLKEVGKLDSSAIVDEKVIVLNINDTKKKKEEAWRISSTYETLKNQLSSLPEPVDVSPLEQEVSSLRNRLTQSTVDTKTKEEKVRFLQERVDGESNALSVLLSSLGQQSLDLQECGRIITVCDELLAIANSASELDDKIKEIGENYEKQSSTLISYEKSLDDIEYNNKLEDILECPCCHNKLQHTDKLITYTGDVQPRQVEHNVTFGDVQKVRITVDKLEQEKQRLIKAYNKYQDILSKEDQRNKGVSLRTLELKSYRTKLHEYSRMFKQKELSERELNQVTSDTREYITKEEKTEIDQRLRELSTQISQASSIEYSRKSISEQIAQIENQFSWLSNVDEHLQELEQQINKLQEDLNSTRQMKERIRIQKIYFSHKRVLNDNSKEIDRLEKRVRDSHTAEHILAESYNEYVGEKLKEIEYDVCVLGKCFFDDTMNITLTPGRETSTGTIKPSFDINVEYGGTTFEDVKSMSTGERKRLSLILMMVLTKYTDGRVMLLDEAFTSVGLDTRGIIMNEIQKLGIPIYLTSHDEIFGYSHELNLNQFSN